MSFARIRAARSFLVIALAAGGFLAGACAPEEDFQTRPSPNEVTIFDTGNIYGVVNGPTAPTVFTITASYKITEVSNYHWNDAHGQPGGTIWMTSNGGQTYGSWNVSTLSGQGGVPNALWVAKPDVVLPAGTYTVGDSSPETWSQNSQSNGRGFSTIKGIKQ